MKPYKLTLLVLVFISPSLRGAPLTTYPNRFHAQVIQNLKQESPYKDTAPPSGIHTIELSYSDPKAIIEALRPHFPTIPMSIELRTRSITFSTDPLTFKKIKLMTTLLDKKLPQIKFEVKIIEIGSSSAQQYQSLLADLTSGFKVNYDFTKNQILPLNNLEGTLAQMIRNGEAKMLSKPCISTLDNNKTVIKVGDQIPYVSAKVHESFVSYDYLTIDTGISMEITPRVTASENIMADIFTQVSSVKVWKELVSGQFPVVSTRKTETKVCLKNHETLLIMGLLDEQTKENISKIPVLADIPGIGECFQSKNQEKMTTDVMFLITPEIF